MIERKILLKEHTTYRIGGPAAYFSKVETREDIGRTLAEWKALGREMSEIFIMGGGANVLFPDSGFDGLIMKIAIDRIELIGSDLIEAGAGTKMKDVVEFAATSGLTGIEWASGLPGYLGGAIRGNAGAFGGEMKDSVIQVESVRFSEPDFIIKRGNTECDFGYRSSIYKTEGGEVIIGAKIRLIPGDRDEITKKMVEYAAYRKEHQPLEFPSAGSTFKNVDVRMISDDQKREWASVIKMDPFPVIPVAFLLSEAGLKGKRVGGATISEKHPNFFVNDQDATAEDVKKLITLAKEKVKEKFNIDIEPEIQII
ncbi:MAG: UDP-N-acetylmuramate dehydrogenase [Candidatus Colwellbacteria bacterium]|nr:UDP-N-acetylmuramate dehydrogenase [Candidatus Colwellbacteria bacterium]